MSTIWEDVKQYLSQMNMKASDMSDSKKELYDYIKEVRCWETMSNITKSIIDDVVEAIKRSERVVV